MIYTLVYDRQTKRRVEMYGIREDAMRNPENNPFGVRVAHYEGGRWVCHSEQFTFVTTPDICAIGGDFGIEITLPWGARDIIMASAIHPELVEGE